ncbi:hypothetical protein DL96DRAFT_1687370 [Flagelloscypha sp. PMI_526]|nr:hypothetical protein DL96DRAFT_1687370 [Flagelloscypha sp. PMI_526]
MLAKSLSAALLLAVYIAPALSAVIPDPPTQPIGVRSLKKRALIMAIREENALIGFDVGNQTYHLYDRSDTYLGSLPADEAAPHLQRRDDPPGCFPLNSEQVGILPGINNLEDHRKSCWGDKELVKRFTNPTEAEGIPTDLKAYRCMAPDPIGQLTYTADPVCDKSTHDIEGESDGTATGLKFSYLKGLKQTVSHSVTASVDTGISISFSAQVGFPGIGEASSEHSFHLDYHHETNDATSEEQNSQSSVEFTYTNPPGQHCVGHFELETCSGSATGNIKTIATGYVWYKYKDAVVRANDGCGPDGSKHWNWAAPLGWLSDEERTISTPLNSQIHTENGSDHYDVDCQPIGGATPPQQPPAGQESPSPVLQAIDTAVTAQSTSTIV